MFLGINSLLASEIKLLCTKYELYPGNRFEKISPFDEYKDISVTKCERSHSSHEFDDKSDNGDSSDDNGSTNPVVKTDDDKENTVIRPPRDI
jgi:hypothetical protein